MHPDLSCGIINIQNSAIISYALMIVRVSLAPFGCPMGIAQYGFKFTGNSLTNIRR